MTILQEVRSIVRERQEVTLPDLAHRLNADEEVVENMLRHWIRRGQIERRESPCEKASCCCAMKNDLASYVWKGSDRQV